jgi:hypothetical protein
MTRAKPVSKVGMAVNDAVNVLKNQGYTCLVLAMDKSGRYAMQSTQDSIKTAMLLGKAQEILVRQMTEQQNEKES